MSSDVASDGHWSGVFDIFCIAAHDSVHMMLIKAVAAPTIGPRQVVGYYLDERRFRL